MICFCSSLGFVSAEEVVTFSVIALDSVIDDCSIECALLSFVASLVLVSAVFGCVCVRSVCCSPSIAHAETDKNGCTSKQVANKTAIFFFINFITPPSK